MTTLGDAARRYAELGWPVFPLRPAGKEPITAAGFHDASSDVDQVAHWWAVEPEGNIGFVPGRAGIVVLDLDNDEARREAAGLGLLAEPTLVVETGRGSHLYFQHPGGTIGNRKLGRLDVRADAGYVLLPPSVHPTGAIYRAHGRIDEIQRLPGPVVELLRPPERDSQRSANLPPIEAGTPRSARYVQAAVVRECDAVARAVEGQRNHALNRAAFALARFCVAGLVEEAVVREALLIAGRATNRPGWDPFPDSEIDRTISSAFSAREVAA